MNSLHDKDEPAPARATERRCRVFLLIVSSSLALMIAGALVFVSNDRGLPPYTTLVSAGVGLILIACLCEIARLRRITRAHALAMIGTNDGMWEWDPVNKELKVGRRLSSILGYADNFLSDSEQWTRLIHPDDRAGYHEAVASHLKGITPHFYHEYRVQAADGAYRWLAARGVAQRDRRGVARLMAGSITDISERRADEARIRYLAHHDSLTGLPNRSQLMEQVPRLISRAAGRGDMLGVLFIDLDRFKTINDAMGHSVGDMMLKSVARRIAEALRPLDQVYRQGGDEFIAVLPEISGAGDAGHVAERILEAITRPMREAGLDLHTAATIGIALFPGDGADAETLLRNADTAMYAAKARGGASCHFFSEQMNERLQRRVALEAALRNAIAGGQMELHYQPQVNVADGRVVGAEALLRWRHEGRLIPPDHFIPVAEETGMIHTIGEWVLDTAISQAARWHADCATPPRIAINLSPRQFWHSGLARGIVQRLQAHRLPADSIELEVTESVLIQPEGPAIGELRALRRHGLHLALDDFGTGYSSLSYLRNLPVNRLKIDKSFIFPLAGQRAENPQDAAAIVRAIIAMAHSLSLSVVAEGVETAAHLQTLKVMGCDLYQGYLLSPALPAEQFAANFLRPA
ncbi:GGDEF domain-containing phosphodiesterase [Zoogloea sp.]|uniref:putative bifunctional diguanylate cyclase/phosphodiesterase n=1 Tax=Zoogloea sp. TaxID=49181 RepID=UPI001ACAEB0C|nr:GGDEF domain-containing phosphodiesterase [Zoogloea sp.]MBN8284361.1 EAL domain-containing protein [Zoogloea sp.]